MKIQTDGFHIFVETETTFGWEHVNIEAEVQHKQGYQKHFKRRVTDRKHKRRNRRQHIDVHGHGMWDFYQSSFHCTYYGGTWDGYLAHTEKQINDILKYYLEDPEWHDKRYGENAIVRWIQNIEREIEENSEDLLPYPDEEQCREPMRRYKDDRPPCDWSGRHDSRPKMQKDLHDKEIRDYLVGTPEIEGDNYLDPEWDEEDMDNPFKRHMSLEDYQELVTTTADIEYERQYWEDVRNGLFDMDCRVCGNHDYACDCYSTCGGCGQRNKDCVCSDYFYEVNSHAQPSFHEPDDPVWLDPYAGSGLDIE